MASLRELLDIVTLYKPIGVLAEEGAPLFGSLASLIGVFAFFAVASLALGFALQQLGQQASGQGAFLIAAALGFFLVQVPFVSGAVFAASRAFSKEGRLEGFISRNYKVLAACSLFMLVIALPLFEFAGMIMLPLGAALYIYFLDALMEKSFRVKGAQSLALITLYALLTLCLALGIRAAAQWMKII